MSRELEGKYSVVAGAASAIGKELALQYANQGSNIALIDIKEQEVKYLAKEIKNLGVNVIEIIADVSSAEQVKKSIAKIEASFSKIDIFAFCVGISTSRLIIDIEEEEWDRVIDINLKSFFLLSKYIAKNMINNNVKNGKIISISSQASKIGELGNGSYCASKAGINSLTQVLALELAPYGIAVNSVCPGYVNTTMLDDVFLKRSEIEGRTPEEYREELTNLVPMKRLCEPEEIAEFMLFLSSDKASYITGISHTIAGGKTLI